MSQPKSSSACALFNPFDLPATVKSSNEIAAGRFGARAFDRTTGVFRSVDIDGDGIPDKARAATAASEIGASVKDAASEVTSAFGSLFKRRGSTDPSPDKADSADI